MPPVVIPNPILNSPYSEPTRHFRFDADDQITSHIDAGRRSSCYFLPIAAPKKKGAPSLFDDLPQQKEESTHVNEIRRLCLAALVPFESDGVYGFNPQMIEA